MKKAILIIFLLILPVAYAQIELTTYKPSYSPGETAQAEIIYSIDLYQQPSANNYGLYLDNTKISTSLSLIKLSSDNHFIYFQLPTDIESGNYLIKLEDITYLEDDVLKQEDFSFPLEINNKNPALSINPAAIQVSEITAYSAFTFELSNQHTTDLNINITPTEFLLPSTEQITLAPNTKQTFTISISSSTNIEKDTVTLTYENSSYEIPFWLPEVDEIINQTEQNTTNTTEISISFLDYLKNPVSEITKTLDYNEFIDPILYIKNNQNTTIVNLTITISPELEDILSYDLTTFSLEPLGEISKNLVINYFPEEQPENFEAKIYSGNISILQENITLLTLPVEIAILEEQEIEEPPETPVIQDNISDTETNYTYVEEEQTNYTWLIWLAFIFIVFLITSIILIYYFKKKKPEEFADFIKGLKGK